MGEKGDDAKRFGMGMEELGKLKIGSGYEKFIGNRIKSLYQGNSMG